MHSSYLLAAVAAASIPFSAAFVPTTPSLATRAAPSLSLSPSRAPLSALRMADDDKAPVGAAAEKYSKGMAHPEAVLGDGDIRKILPHRYPFLLVDKVLEYVPGEMAVAVKCISSNEPQFTGHFPDRPIMPGVLQIEAMAQVGGIVALQPPMAEPGQDFFFGGVDNVKWRRPLVPGDVLVMEMRVSAFKKRFGICKMQGKGYVDGNIAVEGDFTFALAKGDKKE
uniref:3-hydroxyacyl-[acyl-carrier-protein] dehydratase n=2 Tax=Hemiselmis andersenii TaxID=464988 RepID=A0A7S1EJI0_HEMAN|mmetsp:Transcript_52111/g.126329  ORF Transcript_52111/g.126329 Transcript_52111/m.126329 type:complete len:224 (+) Transcript_52111:88-759(+)